MYLSSWKLLNMKYVSIHVNMMTLPVLEESVCRLAGCLCWGGLGQGFDSCTQPHHIAPRPPPHRTNQTKPIQNLQIAITINFKVIIYNIPLLPGV